MKWYEAGNEPATLTEQMLRDAFESTRIWAGAPPQELRFFIHPAEYARLQALHREVNMSKLSTLWAKVKVVAKAAPTYLALAVLVIPIVAEEAVKHLPDHVAVTVAAVAASAVAVLGSIIAVIRRVTPVIAARRGLL
jgi:hypothetical protein